MGSKARIAKDISPILNDVIKRFNITTYIEPFVGGANMIEHIDCDKKFGLDNNEYLIALWSVIQKGWNPFEFEMTKDMYNDIKDNKEKYPKHIVALAGFCATYNAKWFGGYAGIVKTKVGTERNYYDEAVRNLLKQKDRAVDVKFACRDYRDIKNIAGALIYCDPPYANSTQYVSSFNHEEFFNWASEMSKTNFVFISEYAAPNDYVCVWSKELTTTLDKNSRSQSVEKLFTYDNWIYRQILNNRLIA